jgi:hypothetical protein
MINLKQKELTKSLVPFLTKIIVLFQKGLLQVACKIKDRSFMRLLYIIKRHNESKVFSFL